MSPLRALLGAVLPVALAGPAVAEDQFSVKVSLSHDDPDLAVVESSDAPLLEFFVFADGGPLRGGEFGLHLEGGQCVTFIPDPDTGWMVLPVIRGYPGTISQAITGEDCQPSPICFGKLLVTPSAPGARVVVDVKPSERAGDAAIINCDHGSANWFYAFPAVVNPGSEPPPAPHVVVRPENPPDPELLLETPEDEEGDPGGGS